jgi:hypothetical protein
VGFFFIFIIVLFSLSFFSFCFKANSELGQLAQSVERGANNATVAGSIPALTN